MNTLQDLEDASIAYLDGGRIRYLNLPLTSEDWYQCCNRHGDRYVGGCCGNMSAAQDLLNDMLREGSEIQADHFVNYGEMMRNHDGTSLRDMPNPSLTSPNPLERLMAVYDVVKDHVTIGSTGTYNEENVTLAAMNLEECLRSLTWAYLMKPKDSHMENAYMIRLLARTIPLVRTLSAKLADTCPDPIEGFAGVWEKDGTVIETRNGPAIFGTEAEVTDWASVQRLDGVLVRPVKVDLEHGIVLV